MLRKCLIFILICVNDTSAVINEINSTRIIEIKPIREVFDISEPIVVDGIIYKTFKKYYCKLYDNVEDRHTLVYGSQAWTFPRQDVNLTLSYPTADVEASMEEDYLITGYQILLFTDGLGGSAYISSGGVLEDSISLTFISPDITTLSYQFWLYGAPRTRTFKEPEHMC